MANNIAGKNNFTMKTRYGAVAATTIPFVIIGGAYIAFAYLNSGLRRRKEKTRVNKRSISLAALHGGKLALQRLVDYHEARANARPLENALCELNILFENSNRIDILKLQTIVAKLEMSGHEAEAVRILQEETKKAQDEGQIHEAYEIGMSLVEMLIYQGEFEKAFSCKCLKEENMISDARRPLYKAIIIIALERPRYEEEAKRCWENFKEMRCDFVDPPSLKESMQECLEGNEMCKLATNFEEFKKIVMRLSDDINHALVKKKRKNNTLWTSKK